MPEYVAGFAIDIENDLVALIRKSHPLWQAGKLNGVGGRIESGESALSAMRREFSEETQVYISEWREFVDLSGVSWRVHFFVSFVSKLTLQAMHGSENEPIEIHHMADLATLPVIPNLKWLIPLALDKGCVAGSLCETAGWASPTSGKPTYLKNTT